MKQELSEILPSYAKVNTVTKDGVCSITIENCDSNSGDVDFDAIALRLLKYSSSGSVKMNWNFDNDETATAHVQTSDNQLQTNTDLDAEYVCLSTSGDENVCQMCAQFEGKFFLKSAAPKLPLCPSCACAYMHYLKRDLPPNAKISHKDDFVLPAECVSLFYKHHHSVYEEDDINKQIRLCEKDLKKLPEFMAPYLSAGFSAPSDLVCRDLLPELYMRLGEWEKAQRAISLCMAANAYENKDDGIEMSEYLNTYHTVADAAIAYIAENPGCLQKNMYKALSFEGKHREALKHFLRNSLQIEKEKFNNTNKLYVKANPHK